MKSQVRLLAVFFLCSSGSTLSISCKKREYNENSQGTSSLTANSPRFLVESVYNKRNIVKRVDEQFRVDPDAEANGKILVHYNSAQERANKRNGFIYSRVPGSHSGRRARPDVA